MHNIKFKCSRFSQLGDLYNANEWFNRIISESDALVVCISRFIPNLQNRNGQDQLGLRNVGPANRGPSQREKKNQTGEKEPTGPHLPLNSYEAKNTELGRRDRGKTNSKPLLAGPAPSTCGMHDQGDNCSHCPCITIILFFFFCRPPVPRQ